MRSTSIMSIRSRERFDDGKHKVRTSTSPANIYEKLVHKSSNQFRSGIEVQEQPRQIAFALLLVWLVGWVAFKTNESTFSPIADGRASVIGVFIALVIYCMLQSKDGLMVRPHPIVWRAIHGMFLCYFLLLIVFVSLPPLNGITLLHEMLPDIGGGSGAVFAEQMRTAKPHLLPAECAITLNNVWRQISSIWFIAHVAGYWLKMCIFRDWQMCLTYSIAFEVVELSLVWLVPEFEECWWDSVFMDVLGANLLGMILGRITLKYLSCRDYTWEPNNHNPPFLFQLSHMLKRFTPFSWSAYHWPHDEKSWALTGMTWISSIVMEFNTFVILHGLVIRPSHWIHTARLILIGAQAAQSVPEWYEYVRGSTTRIGHNCWLMFVTIIIELLLGFRYGKGGRSYGKLQPPADVVFALGSFLFLLSLWLVISSLRSRNGERRSPVWLMYLRVLAHSPLLLLTRRWVF